MIGTRNRRARVVVYRRERGQVVMSTPDGILRLSAVEARQLAADLNQASLPDRPDPTPPPSLGRRASHALGTVLAYAIPAALLAVILFWMAFTFIDWLLYG